MKIGGADVVSNPEYADDAVREFKRRVPITDDAWDKLDAAERRHAFTIGAVTQAELVSDVFTAIERALADGTTFRDFKKGIGRKLEEAWGRPDANRLELVFDTAVQSSYAAGRWRQMTHPSILLARPLWQLRVILDGRTSDTCKPVAGTTLPFDDPWWQRNTPPRHFRCRSYIDTLPAGAAPATQRPIVEAQTGFGLPPPDDGGSSWRPSMARIAPRLQPALTRKAELAAPPPAVEDIVRGHEAKILDRKTEKAILFNPDTGETVLAKRGSKDRVGFTASEVAAMRDQVLTHNHPGDEGFSVDDMALAATANLRQIRAVGRLAPPAGGSEVFLYTLDRPSGGWPDPKEIRRAHAQIKAEEVKSILQRLRGGQTTRHQEIREAAHVFAERTSARLGMIYRRTVVEP